MAFAARLGALTEQLVDAVAGPPSQSNTAKAKACKEAGLHSLAHHSFMRTNHFDVDNQLSGIEERFRVVNKDDLADALRERLNALSSVANKFTPEVLHLLLELSDQPVYKARLEDLNHFRKPENDLEQPLRWEDIAAEDDWAHDRELWLKADFRDDSSDEDEVDGESDESVDSAETSQSSIEAQHRQQPEDLIIDRKDVDSLQKVTITQSWRRAMVGNSEKVVLSELQVVREVIFMLRGLQNDLYDSACRPIPRFRVRHASEELLEGLLSQLGNAGRSLSTLRTFAITNQKIPLLQVFHDTIEKRLQDFDASLARIEQDLVDITDDTVVSLLQIREDTNSHLKSLSTLSGIVEQLDREAYPQSFRYLELLFTSAELCQLQGDESTYNFIGTIFYECFRVYLRPIRLWMKEGELLDGDRTFFVSKSPSRVVPSQIWQNQFKLRKTPDDKLHAPRFLQPAIDKIFTTGKSVVILKHLGKQNSHGSQPTEPLLDFQSLTESENASFTPFSELFQAGFERWMQSKHHAASAMLRSVLFESCDLLSVLRDLQRVYLMTDGSRSDIFNHALFKNLDLLNPKWHDRFLLEGALYDAFEGAVDSQAISVTAIWNESTRDNTMTARQTVRGCLPALKLNYRMPWPARIVISQESMVHYQAVFTLLLQFRRASYMIQKHRIGRDGVNHLTEEQAAYYAMRARLLWFCSSLQAYLSNIVLAPLIKWLHDSLSQTEDVDAMIATHAIFSKRILDAACLGSKLDPIRDCMLDMMDLAIRLEDARQLEEHRLEEESQELSRLSLAIPEKPSALARTGRYMQISEEEDQSFLSEQDASTTPLEDAAKSYIDILTDMRLQFERHLRFITGGLRGVARASGNTDASKWDILAEMLEFGVQIRRW
ncbi:Spc97/Spc98 family protein [Xylariales sp. PMI_506]|nr:Spc97/Spc98 family protein [Xylariales sp. PMI_506]